MATAAKERASASAREFAHALAAPRRQGVGDREPAARGGIAAAVFTAPPAPRARELRALGEAAADAAALELVRKLNDTNAMGGCLLIFESGFFKHRQPNEIIETK